tara:strand:+ start:797 stop:2443 length:1647 start_codon:yes stop_codon:yes gene_type:complete
MGILSDFLLGPVGEVGYGAMAESYERANKKADDQRELFRGLGQDLRAERMSNEKLLNEKLSNFRSIELDFINNAGKYNTDWEKLPDEDLKLIFAPMAEYLKGDTFVGKPEDVQKKVTEALFQSGGIKVDSPYTSVEEFTNQTKASISKPLELYSGLAWNTWENQVGSLAYKTPEYNMDAMSIEGLRITAMNFPMFYPSAGGIETPAMTVAKLSILSSNAKADATTDGVFDPWKFAELKRERFNQVKDSINMTNAAELFGISENDFMKLIDSGSPSLARLTQITTQLATMDINDPNRQALINESGRLVQAHIEFLDNMKAGLVDKYVTQDSAQTKELPKIAMTIMNANFSGEGEAYKLHKQHVAVLENPTSNIGISMKENFQSNIIEGNDGRNAEQFTFVAVAQDPNTPNISKNKKWLVVSNTGIVFELPSIAAIRDLDGAQGDVSKIRTPSKWAATIDDFNMPNEALKLHAAKAIKYAMEGKLQLTFVRKSGNYFIEDNNYVNALENAGAFGKNNQTGLNIEYFGKKPVEGYGAGIKFDDVDPRITGS